MPLKNKFSGKERSIILLIGISVIALVISYLINLGMFVCVFAIALVILGLGFILKNINYVFWIFIFLLPFTKVPLEIGSFSMQPSQVLICVFAVLYFSRAIAKKDRIVKLPKTPIDLPFAIFVILITLSIYQSYNIPINYTDFVYSTIRNRPFIKSITQIILIIPGVLSFYMTVIFLKNKELIIKTIKVWLFSMFFSSLIGIYEFIIYYISRSLKLKIFLLSFGNYLCSTWNVRFVGTFPLLRISSVAVEPIFFANYIILLLPLAIAMFINKISFFKRRYLLLIIILSSLFCLIFTWSLSTLLNSLTICAFAVYLTRNRNPRLYRKMLIIGSTIMVPILITFHKQIFHKLIFFFDTRHYYNYYHISAFHRAVCWKAAFNMFLRHPLLGVGIGNFDSNFLENIPHTGIIELMTHTGMPRLINNVYIEVLAETGIFGFAAFIFFLYFFLRKLFLGMRFMRDKFWATLLLGLSLGFIGTLASYLFSSSFHFPYNWVLMGLITAVMRVAEDEEIHG